MFGPDALTAIPLELLALPPLAMAAGVDLYLTLLFIGSVPTTGLWEVPLPGALGDLDSPGVLIMVGAFYLLEFTAERFPPASLVWNAFHAIIRPVSGALLALLLLDGQPLPIVAAGSLAGGVIASVAHGVRTGGAVLRWLGTGPAPSLLLVSVAEDVAVLGLASLTLDLPLAAFLVAALLIAGIGPFARSFLRAFAYAIRLTLGKVFVTFGLRRWRGADELPDWVSAALEGDDVLAPGGALRGTPVGAWGLPDAPRFAVGWVVVRGGGPVFVFRQRRAAARIDLSSMDAAHLFETELFRRVDLRPRAATEDRIGAPFAFILFGLGGPSIESLRAEFISA
jgi:uncharacterized protein DUF4126